MILSPVPTLRRKKGTEKLAPVTCAHAATEEGHREACSCHLCPRCGRRRVQEGVRRMTPKIKTVICEQAPNHGSYFAYAWLCFRNSQLFAILQQVQRLRDNSVRVAFFQFLAVTEAPEDTYGEGACRLAGLHVGGGISHVEYFVCVETEPV